MTALFSPEYAPFIAGIALALIALAVVLSPVLGDEVPVAPQPARRTVPKLEIDDEPVPGSAIEALREIEFDRATGKLSDEDYDGMKARYTVQALVELRERDAALQGAMPAASPAAATELAERMVKKYRSGSTICRTHGLRPEPDALFCSECGSYLPGKCEKCGTAVSVAGSHFCTGCGHALAA